MCGPEHPDCGCSAEAKAAAAAQLTINLVPRPGRSIDEVRTQQLADSIIAAVATETPPADLPTQWHAVGLVEGLRTTDHRAIARGGGDFRQLPLPLFAQFLNAGHPEAPIVGSITSITMDGDYAMYEGTFDLTIEQGQQAALMCKNQTLRWVSSDLEVLESRYVEVSTGGGDDIIDILFGDDGGEIVDWYDEVLSYRIMGATMCAMPAFPQCVIAPLDVPLDIPEPMGAVPVVSEGLLASGVSIPAKPPASWFANPELNEPTSLVVDSDGRIYGHLALWGTCHIGITNSCVTPPRTGADYAYFCTGRVECDNGEKMRVGQITFNTGHAKPTLGWSDTAHHYDNTGAVAADVSVGEDELGIWVAGSLRSGLSDADIRAVRAAPLSGDWRKIGGSLELVAALSVNVPGFPIVASAGSVGDEQVSLVASSVPRRDPVVELAREVAQMRRAIAPLMELSVERLSARVNPGANDVAKLHIINIDDLRERVNAG